jgi:membrane protease YdiL (CAAX protease family)
LFFFLLIAILKRIETFALHALHLTEYVSRDPRHVANPVSAEHFIPWQLDKFLFLAIATWIMSRIERRPLAAYGSGGPRRIWNFSSGCLSGVICLSALAGCLWASGLLVFDGRLLNGSAILQWGVIWAVGFLTVALAEETSLRAYLQFTVTRGLAGIYGVWFKSEHRWTLGFWTAAAILACIEMSNHSFNPGESPMGLASVGLFAMMMWFSLWRTGSLWWALGFHAAWDWAESFLFGVADSGLTYKGCLLASHPSGTPILSGGSAGPEGSLLVIPALALAVIILMRTTSRSEWPLIRKHFV